MSRRPIPKADRARLVAWLPSNWERAQDVELASIAWDELGIDCTPELVKHIRHELRLLRSEHYEPPEPTEEEIAEAAAREREAWTDATYYQRADQPVPAWCRRPTEPDDGYQIPRERAHPRHNGREMIG